MSVKEIESYIKSYVTAGTGGTVGEETLLSYKMLEDYMEENNISGICNVDTRSIMRIIRNEGTLKALICDIEKPLEECMEVLKNYQEEEKLVNNVTSKKVWYSRTPNPVFNVAVIDLFRSNIMKPDDTDVIPDGLHPNDKGHLIMADYIAKELLKL